MVELLVMRHAKSDWSSPQLADVERPLAPRGHRAAERMAQWLDDNDLIPDRVVSSAAVRARQTAEYVKRGLSLDESTVRFVDELYLASADLWLEELRQQDADRVLIVGHNPGFDDLVEGLAADPIVLTADGKLMTTAAIAHLVFDAGEWADIRRGTAKLVALARPRELEKL